jgi:hypothetical protein
MMMRMTPIALATHPICSHMCIKSISPIPPTGESRNQSVSESIHE